LNASSIIFYFLSAFILGTGLLSVTTKKIFRAAIWLLFSLVGIAGLFFWMQVEFIAAVQIVIYAGGIVVLIIFSIFLTQQSGNEMPATPMTQKVAALLASLAGFALVMLLIVQNEFQTATRSFDWSISQIGTQMMSTNDPGYALPLEVVSILLLAAMIGCIVIAMKKNDSGLRMVNFGLEDRPADSAQMPGLETETPNSKLQTPNSKLQTP
jgi:NADH-quinone oxidoreductase subunit J